MKNKISINNVTQLFMIVASIGLSLYFYNIFPPIVPTHWGVSGEVNGWGPSWLAAFLLPAILVAIYVLFEWLPKIDPKRENYAEFKKVYSFFKTSIMAVLFGIYVVASLNAIGMDVSVSFWVPLLIGILFVALGNYFGKIRNNYFVGIRTPWTLSSEENWNKTHRLGGKLFIVGGIAMMLMGFLPVFLRLPTTIAIVVLVALVPMIYSYIIYKKSSK